MWGVRYLSGQCISMLGFDFKRISQLRRFKQEFEDLGEIGSGGFAEVHRVRHRLDHRTYAAKILKIKPSFNREDNEEHLYRLLSEPKTQAYLSHPNILEFHGCWMELEPFTEEEKAEMCEEEQPNDEFEMVVLNESFNSDEIAFGSGSSSSDHKSDRYDVKLGGERVERKQNRIGDGSALSDYKQIRIYALAELCQMNLQSFLYLRNQERKEGGLRAEEILRNYQITLDMIAGLMYLHGKRFIHRDIKLHNLMLDAQGRCKLIDFGLAKRVKYWKTSIEDNHYLKPDAGGNEEGDEKFSTSIGTKLFSSPEQASSEKYDYRTDIYSLAMVVVLLFSTYTTAHQQRDLLDKIRKRNLEDMLIAGPLKTLLFRSLGPENERPSLTELQRCVKDLMKEMYLRDRELFRQVEKKKEQEFLSQDSVVNAQMHRLHRRVRQKLIDVQTT